MSTNRNETTSTASASTAAGGTVGASRPLALRKTVGRQAEADGAAASPPGQARNEVVLGGRLAAEAEERELPSGDRIVTLRIVVPRDDSRPSRRVSGEPPRRATVDTIDVVCWTAGTRRTALRLRSGDVLEVRGALRRRFFGGPAGRQSRYEVEAVTLRRVSGARTTGT